MFLMGNALVKGIVKRIGDELQKIDKLKLIEYITKRLFRAVFVGPNFSASSEITFTIPK